MADPDGKTIGEEVFRHYTDEVGKEGIEMAGTISPGSDGRIYLTSDTYGRASEAHARLALPKHPIGYFAVPADAISNPSAPERVLPHYGQPGGGTQIWITERIDAEGLSWVGLER